MKNTYTCAHLYKKATKIFDVNYFILFDVRFKNKRKMESLSISLIFYDVPAISFFVVSKFAKKDISASYEIKIMCISGDSVVRF